MAMISGILSLVGGLVSAAAASAQQNYAAQVAENNATIAEENAQYVRTAGMQQAINTSTQGAAKEAAIVSGIAANNVDVSTGSAVKVEAGQREVNKLDTETVENRALWQAFGYTTQAYNYRAQAEQDKMAANASLFSGVLGAASALPGIVGGGGGTSYAGAGPAVDTSASVDPTLASAGSGGVVPSPSATPFNQYMPGFY